MRCGDGQQPPEADRGNAPGDDGGGGWAWILSDLKTLLETGNAIES